MKISLLITFLLYTLASHGQTSPLVPTQTLLSSDLTSSLLFGKNFAGGDSVGGGDSPDTRKLTAWFYGSEDIDVCYQLSKNFGLNETQVKNQIQSAIAVWKQYFKTKQINSNISPKQKINHSLQLRGPCLGGEDLVLYLGTGPIFNNLGDLRARQSLSRPVAYVNKTHIAQDYFWSKGYIRFVENFSYQHDQTNYFPNWSRDSSFYNLLLHELGHVLGFDHTPDTIMDKHIAVTNFHSESEGPKNLPIDQEAELFSCTNCTKKYINPHPTSTEVTEIHLKGLKQIEFFIGQNNKTVAVKHSIFSKPQINLLSTFNPKEFLKSSPLVYFVSQDKKNYSLELSKNKIFMRQNGELLGTFVLEEK